VVIYGILSKVSEFGLLMPKKEPKAHRLTLTGSLGLLYKILLISLDEKP
jgi:hypothetical protein